ncbi:hypothetical protein Tco_0264341 [Tanacetum coccineum]
MTKTQRLAYNQRIIRFGNGTIMDANLKKLLAYSTVSGMSCTAAMNVSHNSKTAHFVSPGPDEEIINGQLQENHEYKYLLLKFVVPTVAGGLAAEKGK